MLGTTRILWLIVVMALVLSAAGCDSSGPRDTPEATIVSFKEAIQRADSRRIGEFIYDGGDPEMGKLMRRLGIAMGHLQNLGTAVQARFPDEVAKLRADAEAAAKEGRSTSFLSGLIPQGNQVTIGVGGRRRQPSAKERDQRREDFDNAIKSIFADPYGWLDNAETRLTTTFLTDDSVALLWDGKPIMPPLGMTMKRAEDGKWYFVLPLNAPGLNMVMPKTKEQYMVFGSIIHTLDNVILDLTKDVEAGRVTSVDSLGRMAGEKAFIPMVMVFAAYGNLMDDMRRQTRREQQAKQAAPTPAAAPAAGSPGK